MTGTLPYRALVYGFNVTNRALTAYTIEATLVYTAGETIMRFVTVRELRSQSADVWRRLADEPEMVITSNGRPVAILSAVSAEGLEDSLAALRQARAIAAVEAMQRRSVAAGKQRMTPAAVRAEIAAVREGRGQ
jgi:antitoxin (DNA-binding transcriptional repressor) of toxin-antitoxin stability system